MSARVRRLCAAGLALVLAGLGLTSRASFGPRYGGRLVVGVLDLDRDASPKFTRDPGARLLVSLANETLLTRDASGALLPSLAQHWSVTANGRDWTLELSESARFQDDSPLRADDVVRSLKRFLRSDSPAAALLAARLEGAEAFRRGKSDALSGVVAVTPHRVLLRFLFEQNVLPAELTAPAAAITSSSDVGCGPFVPAHVVRGERAALLAFDRHVRGRPFVDNLDVVRMADRPALRLALEHATIHTALGEPGATSPVARLLLLLDPDRKPFNTLAERRRVARAMDRGLLVRRFMPEAQPLWRLLLGTPAPGDTAAHFDAPVHPDTPMSLNVDSSLNPVTSQRVVAQLVALGYRVSVTPLSPDGVVGSPADARLLLWCPEVDDPALVLNELTLLGGALRPSQQAALSAETGRGATRAELDERERALLAAQTVIPLALAPVAAVGPAPAGIEVAPSGTLLLENAWLTP